MNGQYFVLVLAIIFLVGDLIVLGIYYGKKCKEKKEDLGKRCEKNEN